MFRIFSAVIIILMIGTYAYTADIGVTGPINSTGKPAAKINNPAQQSPQRAALKATMAYTVTISSPPAQSAITKELNANFTIISNRPGTICWRLDNGAQTCSAPQTTMMNANLHNLTVGNHRLDVSSTDAAANMVQASRYWTIIY